MTDRYDHVFYYFAFSFISGIFLSYAIPLPADKNAAYDQNRPLGETINLGYFKLIVFIVICFNIARFVSLGQIPLFGNLSARYFDNKLRGLCGLLRKPLRLPLLGIGLTPQK